ncbi:sigma-70 family RNA polymerase sigma factor [Micromonospora sp. RB23]
MSSGLRGPDEPEAAQAVPYQAAAVTDESDEEALRHLEQVHGPVLLSFLTRLTRGDVHRAQDIVQEVLLRAWRHPGARNADGRWSRGWLLTVAKRILIDQLRAANVRPDERADEFIDAYPGTGDAFEQMIDAREVRAALNALPERLRVTLVEVYFQERSVAEVAELLAVPPGTVKSRSFYGLKALREELIARGFVFRSPPNGRMSDEP